MHIEGYFSWTRRQSSRLSCWRPYVRRWNQADRHQPPEFETRYPARFQLIMAANPVLAAWPQRKVRSAGARRPDPPLRQQDLNAHSGSNRHRSGFVPLGKAFLKVAAKCPSEPSAVVAGRVAEARARQADWPVLRG